METFFDKKQPWSEIKHKILKKLLETKSYSSGGKFTYIDGLAGAGSYADGSKGSPLIALNVFNELLEKRAEQDIDAVFIEMDENYYSHLEKRLAENDPHDQRLKIHHQQANFYEILDRAILFKGDAPCLVFIDPCGVKDFSDKAVERIRKFDKKTDLIITFPIGIFRRMTGQGRTYSGTRQTLEEHLNIPYSPNTEEHFDSYLKKLKERYQGVGYIPLYNTKTELFYAMLCTNNINLYSQFNDFLYTEKKQKELFGDSEDIQKQLLACIPFHQGISHKKLLFKLLNGNFGSIKTKEYTKELRNLLKDKKICCLEKHNSSCGSYGTKGIRTRITGSGDYFRREPND